MAGVARVLVTARSDRNRARAIEMGADNLLIHDENLVARATDALGAPADLVYECIGAPGMIEMATACVRPTGTVVVAGLCTCRDSWTPAAAMSKRLTMRFANAYAIGDFHAAAAALDDGHVEPRCIVTETIGLEALPERFEALRTDRTQCKVMVDPWR